MKIAWKAKESAKTEWDICFPFPFGFFSVLLGLGGQHGEGFCLCM